MRVNTRDFKACKKSKGIFQLSNFVRDVITGATKFSDTLTLSQPGVTDSTYHRRGRRGRSGSHGYVPVS